MVALPTPLPLVRSYFCSDSSQFILIPIQAHLALVLRLVRLAPALARLLRLLALPMPSPLALVVPVSLVSMQFSPCRWDLKTFSRTSSASHKESRHGFRGG